MGVFHPDLVGIQVRALQRLGAEHAMVVYGTRRHGRGLAVGRATLVGELQGRRGRASTRSTPSDFGLPMASDRAC